MIARLQKLSFGQVVRNDGPNRTSASAARRRWRDHDPDRHRRFRAAVAYPSNPYVWCVLTVLVGYGIIGFVDDYRKVRPQRY